MFVQTRDRRSAGGELLFGAAAVQLPEEPGVRAGTGGRGRPGGGRAPIPGRAFSLHRHGVRVNRSPSRSPHRATRELLVSVVPHVVTPEFHSSIFSTDSDVFERFIYFSKSFMARCASSAPLPAGRLHSRRSTLSIADYCIRLLFYLSVHKVYLDIIYYVYFLT